MSNNRLAILLEMERQKPDDAFVKFAIANEYVSLQNDALARPYFEGLVKHFPAYVPTYYQLGQLCERLNDIPAAITAYTLGVEQAKAANEHKTAGELATALNLLQHE